MTHLQYGLEHDHSPQGTERQLKVALEEHFIFPDFLDYLGRAMPHVSPWSYDRLIEKLSDFGEERLRAMDAAGVELAVLVFTTNAHVHRSRLRLAKAR
jgi:hypothetical protein